MTGSGKSGLTSIALLVIALGTTGVANGVFSLAAIFLSCVLSVLAARLGSWWWSVVAVLIVSFAAFVMWAIVHSA